MADFATWTIEEAQKAVARAVETGAGSADAFTSNTKFVEQHDHWQDGGTWVGPDGGTDSAIRQLVLDRVKRQFTPVDVIGEVLDNVADALLQREAMIAFAPVEPIDPEANAEGAAAQAEEGARMAETIARWWDAKALWPKARQAVKRSRWSGRGALRLWIAPGSLVQQKGDGQDVAKELPPTLPTGLEFAEAIAKVELSAPTPDTVHLFTDPDTQRQAAIFLYEADNEKRAELWFVDPATSGTDQPVTVLRILGAAKGATPATSQEFRVPLGGRLPIAEMEADVLITEPVRRQQNRLNFAESVMVRVMEAAGFPERYTTNAKPNGIWLRSAPADRPPLDKVQDESGQDWYLHPAPRTLGASITTELVGLDIDGEDGKTTLATPSVTKFEPTDPEYAIKASRHARRTLLESCHQGHMAGESAAEASGIAYEQARARFTNDVENTRSPLEGLLRTILETLIGYGEAMAGVSPASSFLTRYRCVVNARVNTGPITPDQKRANSEQATLGHLSRESAMAANGVEDVTAEITAIESDERAKLALVKLKGEAAQAWVSAGASLAGAAAFVEIEEADIGILTGVDATAPVEQ